MSDVSPAERRSIALQCGGVGAGMILLSWLIAGWYLKMIERNWRKRGMR